jgi:hypothetical protein
MHLFKIAASVALVSIAAVAAPTVAKDEADTMFKLTFQHNG